MRNFYLGAAALVLLQVATFVADQLGPCIFCAALAGLCLGKMRRTLPWIMRKPTH